MKRQRIIASDLKIIANVSNELYLLSERTEDRRFEELLLGMRASLQLILRAYDVPQIRQTTKRGGVIVEWPRTMAERWEAMK